MLDAGVRTREEDGLMAIFLPSHGVRRLAIDTMDLEYLTVALMFTETVWVDDDSISNTCSHEILPLGVLPS